MTGAALLDGFVIAGWRTGAPVHVEFQTIAAPSPAESGCVGAPPGRTCFQGTIHVGPAPQALNLGGYDGHQLVRGLLSRHCRGCLAQECHARADATRGGLPRARFESTARTRVLDVPCGFGRHSLELAARGYRRQCCRSLGGHARGSPTERCRRRAEDRMATRRYAQISRGNPSLTQRSASGTASATSMSMACGRSFVVSLELSNTAPVLRWIPGWPQSAFCRDSGSGNGREWTTSCSWRRTATSWSTVVSRRNTRSCAPAGLRLRMRKHKPHRRRDVRRERLTCPLVSNGEVHERRDHCGCHLFYVELFPALGCESGRPMQSATRTLCFTNRPDNPCAFFGAASRTAATGALRRAGLAPDSPTNADRTAAELALPVPYTSMCSESHKPAIIAILKVDRSSGKSTAADAPPSIAIRKPNHHIQNELFQCVLKSRKTLGRHLILDVPKMELCRTAGPICRTRLEGK